MRARPDGLDDADVRQAIIAGWGIEVASLEYAAVGGGSYHWVLVDGTGVRWFVTVDDLDHKPWLGATRAAAMGGLEQAMRAAVELRARRLEFVVAPHPTPAGAPLRALGDRYAIAVLPFVDGPSRSWDQPLAEGDRAQIVAMLVALHATPLEAVTMRTCPLEVPTRDRLVAALDAVDQVSWSGGPFGERARALFSAYRGGIDKALARFEALAAQVAGTGAGLVVTHGEPHPLNLIAGPGGLQLVDWDTVGLAVPERDLWWVAGDLDRMAYEAATGRGVDPTAMAFYRLRWDVDDLCVYAAVLHGEHELTADTEHAWASLQILVDRLTG